MMKKTAVQILLERLDTEIESVLGLRKTSEPEELALAETMLHILTSFKSDVMELRRVEQDTHNVAYSSGIIDAIRELGMRANYYTDTYEGNLTARERTDPAPNDGDQEGTSKLEKT